MRSNLIIVVTIGLAVALILASIVTSPLGRPRVARLPNLPKETPFKVSMAIVELHPGDKILAGEPPEKLLNDIPGRSKIGLQILAQMAPSSFAVRAAKSRVLRQGDGFDLSYKTAEMDGRSLALQNVRAHFSLETVDTLSTAETDVSGGAEWTVDADHGEGSSIVGYDCFNLGGANMVPLYVRPERSAWIVVSVQKSGG